MALVMTPLCDASTYNELGWLATANSDFTERDAILDQAAKLLAKYEHKWGICLVHRHCSLEEGEIMLATDNVTEPTVPDGTDVLYAERWLSSGQAYEYTTRVTEQPPVALFEALRAIAGGMSAVLGIYHVPPGEDGLWQVEYTKGRKNIVEIVTSQPTPSSTMLEAAWAFGGASGRPSYCQQYCDQESGTGNHVGSHHVIY